MESRLHIESNEWRYFAEAPVNYGGLAWLKALRKTDERFKRKRIKNIIQAYPSEIPVCEVLDRSILVK